MSGDTEGFVGGKNSNSGNKNPHFPISGQYDPKKIEEKWARTFSEVFRANPSSPRKKYCITIPPPNITGSLHIGHALNMTVQDVMVRFKRMCGYEVLWVPGTDHAGIATQHVVLKDLERKGLRREELSRDEFFKFVEEWRKESQSRIKTQMEKLCLSVDWSAYRFTLDEGYRKAVEQAFSELFKAGLIYRGNYIINWCPTCKTALSDLEVEFSEENGKLYYITYPFERDGKEGLQVATTRPETLLGDTAVAVHPDDERYTEVKQVYVPLVWRKVPVIRDERVDREFGTGAVKITPFHDFADFEIAQDHKLEGIKIMNEDAVITYGEYKGLQRYEARKKIVQDLEELGLLVKVEDYKIRIGRCYRCKTVVEPLVSRQWFLKVTEIAPSAIEVVRERKVHFLAKNWENLYLSWMENIRDWCISRQIWWGHRIPVSECLSCGEVFLTHEGKKDEKGKDEKGNSKGESSGEEKVLCPKCGSSDVRDETDVLDTWFSSALWPFAVLGWPEKTEKLKAFYPTDLLVTGFDIIFFWVARMIMMGLYFMKDIPFRKVYVHGLIRDEKGQKMSKTRGNVLDPLDLIEKYGADALRFTLSILASQVKDIKLSEKTIQSFYHFMNKIWNAGKFVLMNLDDGDDVKKPKINGSFEPKTLPQKWIYAKAINCARKVREYLEELKINQGATEIYEFFWNDFCDWYIEISKSELASPETRESAKATLAEVFDISLRLLHPFIPSITAHLWDELKKRCDIQEDAQLISFSKFPEPREIADEEKILDFGDKLISAVVEIRALKDELGFKPSEKVRAKIFSFDDKEFARIVQDNLSWIEKLSGAKVEVELGGDVPEDFVPSSSHNITVAVSSEGAKIKESLERLKKKLSDVEKEYERVKKRLSNPEFIKRADPRVVEEHRTKFDELSMKSEYFRKRIAVLERFVSRS